MHLPSLAHPPGEPAGVLMLRLACSAKRNGACFPLPASRSSCLMESGSRCTVRTQEHADSVLGSMMTAPKWAPVRRAASFAPSSMTAATWRAVKPWGPGLPANRSTPTALVHSSTICTCAAPQTQIDGEADSIV